MKETPQARIPAQEHSQGLSLGFGFGLRAFHHSGHQRVKGSAATPGLGDKSQSLGELVWDKGSGWFRVEAAGRLWVWAGFWSHPLDQIRV